MDEKTGALLEARAPRRVGRMPCEGCGAQFGLVRRRRACPACWRACCGACLRRGAGRCEPCFVLSARPLLPAAAAELRVRDLQLFLRRRGVDTARCLEKDELVSLAVQHVNGITFQQSDPRPQPSASSGTFSSLKDFTNNINELITSAFDLRSTAAPPPHPRKPPAPTPARGRTAAAATPPSRSPRPTPAPSPAPTPPPPPPAPCDPSPPGPATQHTETRDCFEIEDVQETNGEQVAGAPLPVDCDLLLTEADAEGSAEDEDTAALAALSARALKRLLARNGVEFRGCVERGELEARGRRLLEARRAERAGGEPSSEDACKICLSAPLEVLLLECGHMVACAECARRLAECPVCRRYVARVVRVFRA